MRVGAGADHWESEDTQLADFMRTGYGPNHEHDVERRSRPGASQPVQATFRLHLEDGKGLRVPHPDFALVTAEYVVVANELPGGVPGNINLVPYEHIVRVEMLPRKTTKAA